MPQADPVADRLRKAPVTPAVRADAWDAFQAASDLDDFTKRLSSLSMPDAVKADLWDLKAQSAPKAPPVAPAAPAEPPNTFGDALIGIGKGAAGTAINLGLLVHKIPGVSAAVDAVYGDAGDGDQTLSGLVAGSAPRKGLSTRAFEVADEVVRPTNTAQRIGKGVEQIAEFMVPAAGAEKLAATVAAKTAPILGRAAPVVARAVTQGATSAGVAEAQGGDPMSAGLLAAAVPAAGVLAGGTARMLRKSSEGLVRAAIKPTVSAMKKISGTAGQGLDAKAESMVRFIIDNRLTTPEKARDLIVASERELQRLLAVKNAPTDAPQRAIRYLAALERNAAKQGLAADDVAQLRNAAAELIEGGMGKNVVTMIPTPHPTLVQPNGQPFMVLTPKTSRVLRTDVMADEALDSARASSKWTTRKQWGEQKGTRMEAEKAVERAQRDAVKEAIPEARPVLAAQGNAIRSAETLDRMQLRAGNHDAVSLPAQVVAAAELAQGRVPLMAFAANWLRNNQLKAGMGADALANAIQRNDVRTVSEILGRLGVALEASHARP